MTNRHLTHQFEESTKKNKATNESHAKNKASGVGQVVYADPKNKKTMVLLVNATEYTKWQKSPDTVATSAVVDSFDVLKYETGRSGIMNKPSKSELDAVFGTTRTDTIVPFMLQHGSLHIKAM